MAVKVEIVVANISATLGAGYTHVKLYRSAEQLSGFYEITTPPTRIVLQAGVSSYTFIDKTGTTKHWYQTSFFDGTLESSVSSSFLGTFIDANINTPSYIEEAVLTSDDHYVLQRIRNLIGDTKELTRDYISENSGGFDVVSLDGRTVSLSNPRGWPVSISHNGALMTTASGAVVQDFQFVTLSGTVNIAAGSTDIVDIWYYHFRIADSEILTAYNGLTAPPQLNQEDVSFELAAVCTAIDLLASEMRKSGVTSGTEVDIFEEIRINPKGGLSVRAGDLESLRNYKKYLIDQILMAKIGSSGGICGVLID